jgi:hypothetical protein
MVTSPAAAAVEAKVPPDNIPSMPADIAATAVTATQRHQPTAPQLPVLD